MASLKPETPEQVVEAVAWAAAEQSPLEVMGRGSKRAFGRPVQAGHGLDLSGLTGITLYEPEELVMSARAGTPMAEVEAAIEAKGQMLAFERGLQSLDRDLANGPIRGVWRYVALWGVKGTGSR